MYDMNSSMIEQVDGSTEFQEFRIVTWNINGIRSFSPEQFKNYLDSLDADIICVQETKITGDCLDKAFALVEGYQSFFSFSRARTGYSGVATFCKTNAVPLRAEEGLTGILVPSGCTDAVGNYGKSLELLDATERRQLDAEGRAIITQHSLQGGGLLTVINVYCPKVDPDQPKRLKYKLQFYQQLFSRAEALRHDANSYILMVGDFNCSHQPIDSCNPGDLNDFYVDPSRQWLNSVLKVNIDCNEDEKFQLVDSFRHLHPDARMAYTCWNTKTGARQNNYGTRIDYIFCDLKLAPLSKKCDILSEVMGSDHCPVKASFNLSCVTPSQPPSLCTKFFPEFSGTQQKLLAFLLPKCHVESSPNLQFNSELNQKKRKQTNIKDFFGIPKEKTSKVSNNIVTPETCEDQQSFILQQMKNKPCDGNNAWKAIFSGPPPVPLCRHGEKCVIKTCKKPGPNMNRQFFSCCRGIGSKSNPESNCNFFQWVRK